MADKKQVLGRAGRVEREQRQNRILLTGAGIVIGSIVLVLLVGMLTVGVIQPNQPILEVNGEVFDTGYFQDRVRLSRYTLIQQYSSTFEYMYQFGQENPQLITQFDQQLRAIEYQLSPAIVGQTTLDQLTDAVLIREAAEELGISVSEEEIVSEIESNFGYFPDGQPTAAATRVVPPVSTLTAAQLEIVTPTATVVIPEETEEEATAEEETVEEEPVEEVTPAPTFEVPPSPTIIPTEEFGVTLAEDLSAIADAIQADEDILREFFTERLLRNKVFETVTADTPTEKEMVWAQHILVETEEQAWEIYEALQDGADWTEQAAIHSTDQSNSFSGGNLGWFDDTTMVAPFSEAAFAGKIGDITEPVQSDFGWHLIQIVGHEMRPMDADQYEQEKETAFNTWLDSLIAEADIVTHEYWIERVPETPTIDLQILQQVAYIRQQLNAPVDGTTP